MTNEFRFVGGAIGRAKEMTHLVTFKEDHVLYFFPNKLFIFLGTVPSEFCVVPASR
jgi:hypothetical protein